ECSSALKAHVIIVLSPGGFSPDPVLHSPWYR
ncbi:MAG: hypothetical protein ACI9AO_001517, partial [Ilumatobacter sp.]